MTDVRADIPAKYKWDLSVIYADMAAFDADYDRAKEMIAAFPAHKDTMLTSAEALYNMFCDMTALGRILQKLYSYASLNSEKGEHEESSDSRSWLGRARTLCPKLQKHLEMIPAGEP